MAGLGIKFMWIMIISVILTGGIALVVTQNYVTKIVMPKTIDKYKPES